MLWLALYASVVACKDDDLVLDPETAALVDALNLEAEPLSADPLQWTDEQLSVLNDVSGQSVIGLGEATHGTAEFFKAKHRIFRYMAEHHGYRIFAIEADFGESLFINEAVLNSDKSKIETLMRTRMHFWTWRTNEVRDLLYWMCDFNMGKPANEKVQYWGVDCQFNTYHPDLLLEYLVDVDVSFLAFAESTLMEAKSASSTQFTGYTGPAFEAYLDKIDALNDSIVKYDTEISAASSETSYQLNLQLLAVIRQVSEVIFDSGGPSRRDEFMAVNTKWLFDYFDGAEIVLWAHNFHVSDFPEAASMGSFLKTFFPGKYYVVGFLFSKGFFRAVTFIDGKSQGLHVQSIDTEPKAGSLNELFGHATGEAFTVAISDLEKHSQWPAAFDDELEYFQMGAVYNGKPLDYYQPFRDAFYDRLIYFDHTTAAVQVP